MLDKVSETDNREARSTKHESGRQPKCGRDETDTLGTRGENRQSISGKLSFLSFFFIASWVCFFAYAQPKTHYFIFLTYAPKCITPVCGVRMCVCSRVQQQWNKGAATGGPPKRNTRRNQLVKRPSKKDETRIECSAVHGMICKRVI